MNISIKLDLLKNHIFLYWMPGGNLAIGMGIGIGSARGDMGGFNMACGSHGSDVSKESGRKEDTPPPLPTNFLEFVMRGLVLGTCGCFGVGPIAGLEGVGVIRVRRNCKP